MLNELERFNLYKQSNPNELTVQQFLKIEKEISHPNFHTISDEYLDFQLWCKDLPSRQESFAKYIIKNLSKYPCSRILEVGGGRTGMLSRYLSEVGFNMTCIDPNLEIISNEKIEFIKGIFLYKKFDISDFDFVVAQEPCDATEHVVRSCIDMHIPFIMSLCGVPHKLISGKTPKDVSEWYNYLVSISPDNIKLRFLKSNFMPNTPILKCTTF